MDADREWATRRNRALAVHAANLARREAAETARTAELLREFVAEARECGLAPVPCRPCRTVAAAGRSCCWYLSPDQTMAVAEDGRFYLLTVRGALAAAGVEPDHPPPLPGSVHIIPG